MRGDEENTGVQGDSAGSTQEESSPKDGAQVESSEGHEQEVHHRPSRAKARIEQLARRNRQLEEQVAGSDSLQERLNQIEQMLRGRNGQTGSVQQDTGLFDGQPFQQGSQSFDPKKYWDQKWSDYQYDRELREAKDFLRGQEGYSGEEDWAHMQEIAEENGWDTTSTVEPMRAARLIAKHWRKEKGLEAKNRVPPKTQAASVQGAAPQSAKSQSRDQLNARARAIIDGNVSMDSATMKKELDAIYGALKSSG